MISTILDTALPSIVSVRRPTTSITYKNALLRSKVGADPNHKAVQQSITRMRLLIWSDQMANQSGFQANSTIHAAFWIYKPDPKVDPIGREVLLQVNNIQKIEATQDHNKVWIHYAATDTSTSQRPEILEGVVAQAFMNDMEALFS